MNTDRFMHMASAPQTTFDRAAAEYIRTAAGRKKLTQKELGQRAGVPPATFGNYWRGETSMTLGTLKKIFAVLGADWAEAFDEIDRIEVALKKSESEQG